MLIVGVAFVNLNCKDLSVNSAQLLNQNTPIRVIRCAQVNNLVLKMKECTAEGNQRDAAVTTRAQCSADKLGNVFGDSRITVYFHCQQPVFL